MNFQLTEQQQKIRQTARDFANNAIAPTAAQRDEEERFDPTIFHQAGSLGLAGLPFPRAYGGGGLDTLCFAIAVEEIAKVCASTADTIAAHTALVAWPIFHFGTEEQKKKFLMPLARGEKIGAFALTEENAGSDAGNIATTAVKQGKHWVLNGRKIFITNGNAAQTYLVIARTGEERYKGLSAFLVEKGTPGLSFGPKMRKLGIRSTLNCDVIFENCSIPEENLLGKTGQGFKIAMQTLDGGRIGIAAQALGIAAGAYGLALDFAKKREQFGRPISSLQAIQFKLADMEIQIAAARLLVYQAAFNQSNGLPYGKEAAIAKCFAGDAAVAITSEALQIFGGRGYSRDYPLERMYRDAKITQIYEGTNEIQRVVIASQILK